MSENYQVPELGKAKSISSTSKKNHDLTKQDFAKRVWDSILYRNRNGLTLSEFNIQGFYSEIGVGTTIEFESFGSTDLIGGKAVCSRISSQGNGERTYILNFARGKDLSKITDLGLPISHHIYSNLSLPKQSIQMASESLGAKPLIPDPKPPVQESKGLESMVLPDVQDLIGKSDDDPEHIKELKQRLLARGVIKPTDQNNSSNNL